MRQNHYTRPRSNPDKIVYIYCLWCPVAKKIRYIGQSNQPETRAYLHIFAAKRRYHRHHTSMWLRKLIDINLEPRLRILMAVPAGENWQDHERSLISRALSKGWPLTNQSAGGDGVVFLTEEAKAAAKIARRAGVTPEVRKRMSESMRAAWANPKTRAGIVARQKEAAKLPERRAHLGSTRRTPEGDGRRVAAVKAYYADPENRKKLSPAALRLKNDPSYAAAMGRRGAGISRRSKQKESGTPLASSEKDSKP